MDMTPANLVGMAALKGLDVIALTDHNAALNCRAAIKCGEAMGVLVIPGMELTTCEEVHVVCLFPDVQSAEEFGREVYAALPDIKNRTDIFGEQVIMDEDDARRGTLDKLLINATSIPVNEVGLRAAQYGGAAFPAHIDKPSNGIIGVLGAIPPEAGFASAEISGNCVRETFLPQHPETDGLFLLSDSDAHYLWQINERINSFELPELTPKAVIDRILRRKK
jgi:hypothetical protein